MYRKRIPFQRERGTSVLATFPTSNPKCPPSSSSIALRAARSQPPPSTPQTPATATATTTTTTTTGTPLPFNTKQKSARRQSCCTRRTHSHSSRSVRSKQGTPIQMAAWAVPALAAAAWALRAAVWACLAASAMLVAEAAYMGLASLASAAAMLWRRPDARYRWEPMPGGCDVEAATGADFPMVLVQIPMYNEREELVELECQDWATKKINIKYEVRNNRKGYKAVNYDVCLMTRIQKMSLDYHFKVEQESGSFVYSFFGFNGTAGVWRVSAINQSGGWKDRTTVEDMDLAVRASLKGWEFLLRVNYQVPSKPTVINNIGGLVVPPISSGKWHGKSLRTSIPVWGLVYIPTAITCMNAIRNPWSLHLMPFWILFENVMSMHRMRAAVTGLLETARANDWVVTEKVGDLVKDDLDVPLLEPVKPTECVERIYFPELLLALHLLICASYDFVLGSHKYYLYIYLQAFAYVVMGFGFVGTKTPCS
uniref:Mannan synthase 7 n=1 Tax=Zea mays TaxID=4577 RepID=A0A804LZT9_MAIZE